VLVVAELLDHSDTQSAGIYVEATPQMLQRIYRAVAFQLAPLARAFAGTLIAKETEPCGPPIRRVESAARRWPDH
jgi:hypothetical protein